MRPIDGESFCHRVLPALAKRQASSISDAATTADNGTGLRLQKKPSNRIRLLFGGRQTNHSMEFEKR
jgi:hypothetical protein